MLILLPDFIGHPSCFRGLLARLGATDCRLVDYHRLDAYASIEALASQVLDGLAEEPDWLIGYSFGGLVGYEMARQLPASRLLMIDSHLPWPALRRMPPSEQYQRWLSAEMREWIALMSELGELREEVLLRNVELFGRWQPRHRLARASWVRCRDDAGRDPAAERWCDLIEQLDTFPCETCTATTRSSGTTGSPAPGSTRWSATICASRACCATRRSSSATPTSPTSRCTRTSRYGRSATKARRPSGSP